MGAIPLFRQIRCDNHGRLESLQRLQSLQRLESLESLQSLETSAKDYRDVVIPPGACVYCDPLYPCTAGYGFDFDFNAFDEWLRTRDFPVYVSEYDMPEDFIPVWGVSINRLANQKGADGKARERLWVHRRWAGDVFTGTLF